MKRIGVFGGTFDPPHLGHLVIAEWARIALGLERVVFVPAGTPPHKTGRRVTPARHRLGMARLAARGNPAFEVSTLETSRRGPSYTVETLRTLRASHPGARLYLIVGRDSLDDFGTWREPAGIQALATLVVAERGRSAKGGAATHRGRAVALQMPRVVMLDNPVVAISSSEIRARMRRGRSARYLVPDAVTAYATRHGLYRQAR